MPVLVKEPPKKPPKPKTNACQHFWTEKDGIYELSLSSNRNCDGNKSEFIQIRQLHDLWEGMANLAGRTYKGQRPTLEACFKALDRIFYTCYPELWVKVDVTAVIAPWKGDLKL